MPISTSDQVRELAAGLGFDVCRLTSVEEGWGASHRLRAFVEAGYHGQMEWMEETLTRRAHPQAMWPDAKSAVVVAMNYGPETDPMVTLEQAEKATISVYARNKDYHDVLKKRLKQLAREFVQKTGEEVKVFVDTAPLMEKPLAAQAGVGWQGKHTNLVSRDYGSWLFLGVMLTSARLDKDEPETDTCGSCRACLDICPTKAFVGPYKIDARKCVSYLTIEHKGVIPIEFREQMGNRIYGCDDCLSVCPWNKFAKAGQEEKLIARQDLNAPDLIDFLDMDDARFRAFFSGSPVKRIKRERFLRNVLIAVGNAADQAFLPKIELLLEDADATVRASAVWALNKTDLARYRALKPIHLPSESDEAVRAEWDLA